MQTLKRVKEGLKNGSEWLNWYFLGIMPASSRKSEPGQVILGDQDIFQNCVIFQRDEGDDFILNSLQIIESLMPEVFIVYLLPSLSMPNQLIDAKKVETFIYNPRHIEEVIMILDELLRKNLTNFIIIIQHLSMLPSKTEQWSNNFIDYSPRNYDDSYERLLFGLKRRQKQHHFSLALVDNETLLGEKKSALVRRLFC